MAVAMSVLVAVAKRLPPAMQRPLISLRASRFNLGRKADTLHRYGVSFGDHPLLAAKYLLLDPEMDNFTYDLANEHELVHFLAQTLRTDRLQIEDYVAEISNDPELNRLLRKRLRGRWDRKHKPHFGRRIGWYAIARTLKPSVIVETGIHDGFGSILLLRALARNASEGHDGRLISFDINPQTGWLVSERLRGRWQPVYEATFDALESTIEDLEIGMIIHDSEHTYECEQFELETAASHAASTIALVSDNAHATTALRDVAAKLGIEYHFFQERPLRHFYPGAGIGLAIWTRS
jgi:Methyltransferase domain